MSDSKELGQFENTASGQLETANILVIEDDTAELKLLENVLTRAGYRVRPTRDARSGFRAARLLRPDAILLDIRLPDQDGFDVCRQLKDDPALQDIPVIFVSGLSDIESHVRGFEVGGRDFITKPFQEIEVVVRVQNQIEIQEHQRRQRAHAQLLERHRIARDLHDSVSQTLFALDITTQDLAMTETSLSPDVSDRLKRMHKLTRMFQ